MTTTLGAGVRLNDVRRIAVLRANGIGDLVFALPALDALRATYGDAEIVLLARSYHRELLDSRRGPVDRVVALPPSVLGEDPDSHARAVRDSRTVASLRSQPWDLAVQLHGGGKLSNPFVALLGARLTVGCRDVDAPALDRTVPYRYWQHEVLRNLEVVAAVGATPTSIEPRIAVTLRDARAIRRALGARPGEALPPLAVLHPGAGDPRRRWPVESFARVGDRLAARGLAVIIVGSATDVELGAALQASMSRPALDMTARLDLPGLLGLLSEAAVFVGNDSGPLHLAEAVGTRTVGIFWCGNLINAGPLFRERAHPLIAWRTDCPVCGVDCIRSRCEHEDSFVADVDVEEVLAAASGLLEVRA